MFLTFVYRCNNRLVLATNHCPQAFLLDRYFCSFSRDFAVAASRFLTTMRGMEKDMFLQALNTLKGVHTINFALLLDNKT